MFAAFFLFELRYHFQRLSTYVYFGLFLLIGFILMNAVGGAFNAVSVGGSGGQVDANAPLALHSMISLLSCFGVIVTSAIAGNAVYRDYEYNTHALFYTKPISKQGYLLGRFAGAIVVLLAVFSSIALGMIIGSFMPWLEHDKFGPFNIMSYVTPYLTSVLPNLVFTGALFFALATTTRSIFINYVVSIVFLLGYLVALNLFADMDNKQLAAFIDPFGNVAGISVTRYWTIVERNTQLVPLKDLFLYNRLLWTGIGAAIFAWTYMRFTFSQFASSTRRKKTTDAQEVPEAGSETLALPHTTPSFSVTDQLYQMWSVLRREFISIVKSPYFLAIAFAGMLFLFVSANVVGTAYDTDVYPVTYSIIELTSGTFYLFVLIIITFYAGELIWREREQRLSQMIDALPVPTWTLYTGKLGALMLIQPLLLGIIMVCGMIIQMSKGYFNLEPGLYIRYLFGTQLIDYWLLCVLAVLVHVIVNHKYTGHFLMVLYYLVMIFLPDLGFEHILYRYGADPGFAYSDMNGFGPAMKSYFWFKLYWAACALLLAVLSNVLWVRGSEDNWQARIHGMALRMTKPMGTTAVFGAVVFFATGGFIFYNTNILNSYRTKDSRMKQLVRFEQKYKKYENLPQLRITDVRVDVDIYPDEQNLVVRGRYILKNKTSKPIDNIHLNVIEWLKVRTLKPDCAYTVVLDDKDLGYYIYKLASPVAPGDSIQLFFDVAYLPKGFTNEGPRTDIVSNGSFFSNVYMPVIGYSSDSEIADDDERKKYGLKPKERMPDVNDLQARMNTYISNCADWLKFEATVSTTSDQIAIAPGYLQKEWTKGGRRYFHYAMDAPILNFVSFLSARYEVRRDRWKDVAIEIYYHKGHEYNIDRMIRAIKKSLDYYTVNFSPYQHKQVRIIEFPRYASFAQSFPNTIPYSESIGFIARVDDSDPEGIDFPFYVTAHEVAHQWWAHQVIGGNVQGATLLSESMAQYSALMVMEKEYGRQKMRRFLQYELDAYLRSRGDERKKEQPLYLVENQQYIHYNKGAVVLYALRDYLGEETLNKALAGYVKQVAFQEPPYTNSIEFVNALEAATPDSLQYLIYDMLETITLYDNKVTDVSSTPRPDGKYSVQLTVESKKLRSDGLGSERPASLSDWVDIGVFGTDAKGEEAELFLKKYKLSQPKTVIKVVVDAKPTKAGVDPYNKLIDRNSNDNIKAVSAQKKS